MGGRRGGKVTTVHFLDQALPEIKRHHYPPDARAKRRKGTPATRTAEQRRAFTAFRSTALEPRLRVVTDDEGWPTIVGKLGRIEWHDGVTLAVYSDRPRLFARLRALSGIRPWQVGDQEIRVVFAVEFLPAVARLIRAQRRRSPESTAHLQKVLEPAYSTGSAA
jgi:hypothetical protein